jgi:pSer/pThr/pTyr-binding forkhead associated (FHA) protein
VFLRVLRAVWVELRAEQGVAAAAVPAPVPVRAARPRPGPTPGSATESPSTGTDAAPAGRLIIVAPPGLAGRSFVLEAETTIGRASGCGVPIDDSHVSKVHARVFFGEGSWLVEDLGSTNGTLLDGSPVTGPTPVGSGSRVKVGEVELEFT